MKTETHMPLMAHLTELRKRLLWSVFALLIGMGIARNYADHLLAFIERPLTGHSYLLVVKARAYAAVQARFLGRPSTSSWDRTPRDHARRTGS